MQNESANIKKLIKKFGKAVIGNHSFRGDDTIIINKNYVLDVCRFLKEEKDLDFNFMMDLTAVDYLNQKDRKERFEVVYHFYSLKHNHRIRVKAPVSDADCAIDSIVPLWVGADWFEREAYDMYGIKFNDHPNLKRILLYEEFVGYPLRKDYPIRKRQPLIGPKN
jgi:NADH-quinone oxidoreductase subunit C